MAPANPPLPTCWYLPFQLPSVGIHTSKFTFDCGPGLMVPATRQRPTGAFVGPEMVSPAAYVCASVIVVFGNARFTRSAHVVAAAGAAQNSAAAIASGGATMVALDGRITNGSGCNERCRIDSSWLAGAAKN